MSKIGVYADPHFSTNSSIIMGSQNGLSQRLNNLIESFKWMNQLFKDNDVEITICLGDLTDRPNLSAEEITALSQCDLQDHHFIVGNHCRADKNGNINALATFKNVYTKPTVISVGGKRVLLLPYTRDYGKINEQVDIILSHNDIESYNFGSFLSRDGFKIVDILKSCQLYVNGHLHTGGWVVKDRIINLGQLTGMNFSGGEGEWEPSVGIIDTDTLMITLYENPIAYRFKKLECKKLPTLKTYIDQLPDIGQYVLQVKTTAELADNCRTLLNQNKKVVASRVITYASKVEKPKETLELNQAKGSVYSKFRTFLAEQKTLKFDINTLYDIIDSLNIKEVKEDTAECKK